MPVELGNNVPRLLLAVIAALSDDASDWTCPGIVDVVKEAICPDGFATVLGAVGTMVARIEEGLDASLDICESFCSLLRRDDWWKALLAGYV